jgi:hypothetical protein
VLILTVLLEFWLWMGLIRVVGFVRGLGESLKLCGY